MKRFVLDTNVLLHNSNAVFAFGKNHVIIPITVIEELDKFKSYSDEKGRHARNLARHLDTLRKRGKLYEGVKMDNGGICQVVMDVPVEMPRGLMEDKLDNRILMTALAQQRADPTGHVCFVTKDINARIKADAIGIYAEDFETNKVNIEELYQGWRDLSLTPSQQKQFEEKGEIVVDADPPLHANEFVVIRDSEDLEKGLYARYDGHRKKLVALDLAEAAPWGITALNAQQLFALEALLDNRVSLITLVGMAGTGKTLLAIAAGLQKTIDDRTYRRMLVSRPIMPMGRDIGYLPGTKDEKLTQWMQPIFDNLEYIFSNYLDGEVKAEEQLQFLLDSKKIELEALTYIRGRSIPNQYLIIDEAQNLTPHEVKTIISRAGEGTKVVLTGDPYQIDNPGLDGEAGFDQWTGGVHPRRDPHRRHRAGSGDRAAHRPHDLPENRSAVGGGDERGRGDVPGHDGEDRLQQPAVPGDRSRRRGQLREGRLRREREPGRVPGRAVPGAGADVPQVRSRPDHQRRRRDPAGRDVPVQEGEGQGLLRLVLRREVP
ncbi:MAG: PhoH family protein [Candidatus Riflebacteria bacterium]|nr:PhoH family protein [Candidatus Riflebacteria bacterium]